MPKELTQKRHRPVVTTTPQRMDASQESAFLSAVDRLLAEWVRQSIDRRRDERERREVPG